MQPALCCLSSLCYQFSNYIRRAGPPQLRHRKISLSASCVNCNALIECWFGRGVN